MKGEFTPVIERAFYLSVVGNSILAGIVIELIIGGVFGGIIAGIQVFIIIHALSKLRAMQRHEVQPRTRFMGWLLSVLVIAMFFTLLLPFLTAVLRAVV